MYEIINIKKINPETYNKNTIKLFIITVNTILFYRNVYKFIYKYIYKFFTIDVKERIKN